MDTGDGQKQRWRAGGEGSSERGVGRSGDGLGENLATAHRPDHRVAKGVAADLGSPQLQASDADEKPWYCFAPQTSPALIERVTGHRHAHSRPGDGVSSTASGEVTAAAFQLRSRWTSTATNSGFHRQGDPITVTWSIIPDGTPIPATDAFESSDPSNLRATLDSLYGSESQWLPLFQQTFDRWSEVSGIRYVYEPNDDGARFPRTSGRVGVRGDVRIGGHRIDGPSDILAYNYYPSNGDMVFDTADNFNSFSNNSRQLRNIIAHEAGHGLGLGHVCPREGNKLMEPWLTTAFDGPQHDDIFSAQRHYGDRYEDMDSDATSDDNDTRTNASDLGHLPVGRTDIELLSIDDDTDQDYFRFTKGGDREVSIVLTPVGRSYREGSESGACASGATFNSGRVHDLGLSLLDSSGVTLATRNASGVGTAERLTEFSLPSGEGPFYIRVFGSGVNNAQLYDLSITLGRVTPSTLVSVDSVTVPETSDSAELVATIPSPVGLPVSFDYVLEGITATPGEDFTAAAGTVTIPAGQVSAGFSIDLQDDQFDEPSEFIRIRLSNPINAGLLNSLAIVTILDNDQTVLSIGSVKLSETEGELEIPISLSTPSQHTVSVSLNTIPRTATEGRDFEPLPDEVHFQPGQVFALARTALIDDSQFERTEDFVVQLLNPTNAGIAVGTGRITIYDNEVFDRLSDSVGISTDPATGELSISWDAVPDFEYTILVSTDLLDWEELPGAAPITAASFNETYTFTPAAGARAYYRIVEGYVP